MMNNKTDAFLTLIRENPDLPIVPMVDAEVVGDDTRTWMGIWGAAKVDEYLLPENDYESLKFKSDDDVFDVLEERLSEEEFDALPENMDECRKVYDALPWVKAIIVEIIA